MRLLEDPALRTPPVRRAVINSFLCVLAAVTLLGAGCGENPNGQGLQDFGSITGRLIDDRTGQPVSVSPMTVSVGSTVVSQLDNQGGFVLPRVPAGKQTITVYAIGYLPQTLDVNVLKNQASDAGYIRMKSVSAQ